ncbi:uroporphyrinogen-III synthase [Psychrobacter sp. S1-30-MNA-CIBAN-0213]|uniref:uroporphyrinogen-III synthase n=1 Tax=unclassified Psychrobacter TaxID=196806 RepID=UPI00332EC808
MSRALLSQSIGDLSLPPAVVINTRPLERAAPLTEHLQAAGLTVVDMPMLTLQPRAVNDTDIELMRDWLAGNYEALVIVSPTAAASGLAVWQALEEANKPYDNGALSESNMLRTNKAPSHLIAVGEATASVLQDPQLPFNYPVLQPTIANNEGMLAMPEIEHLQAGDKLLIWRGLGGRRLLVDTLKARGVHIDSIAWYERILPTDASTNYKQWLEQFIKQNTVQSQQSNQSQASKPIVVISSGTAFEHWSSVVQQTQSDSNFALEHTVLPVLSDFNYVVLGERLADMVAAEQLSYWRVEDLSPATILAAIVQNVL